MVFTIKDSRTETEIFLSSVDFHVLVQRSLFSWLASGEDIMLKITYGGWKCFPVKTPLCSPPDTLALSSEFIATQQFVP